jgi:catechol 2,3-dioxygenase-like lactoylglutathione lyase family enzyme
MSAINSAKIRGISHLMLGVSNLDRSLAFYRDALRLDLQRQFPGFAFFNAGGVTLVLNEALFQALGGQPGASEIVFDVADVDAAHADLMSRHVQFSQAPRQVTPSEWAANFQDPDGHRLSIFGPRGGGDSASRPAEGPK